MNEDNLPFFRKVNTAQDPLPLPDETDIQVKYGILRTIKIRGGYSMSYTTDELLDQNGNYDINRGYKYIFKENADEALKEIRKSLDYVKKSQCIQSKRSSYLVGSHACEFDEVAYRDKKNGSCFRREEWICKRCKGESFNFIGKIVDYQVPLKHKHSQECSGLGKVDLLSQNGSVAYLLEVKTRENTESPLRAIMEIYTYV